MANSKQAAVRSGMVQSGGSDALTGPAEHNDRIASAVSAYCRFPHPQGFAVMIDGPWGSGKTHMVKSLMDRLAEENPERPLLKPLYVSLYGVGDVGAINEQLFEQVHPVLGHKYTRLAGRVLRGAAKVALKVDVIGDHRGDTSISAQLPELKLSDLTGGAAGRTLVFDDFERAAMTPAEVLGYINPLVEHDGCKVLILANEAEVEKQDPDYVRRREKTVGLTLRMRADARAAFPAFLARIGVPGAGERLRALTDEILAVFADSRLDNLRLLERFVWDFGRVWAALGETYTSHDQATGEIARLLCAAVLELRSGNTEPSAFRTADMRHFMDVRQKAPDPVTMAAADLFRRYPTASFEGGLLKPETVRDIVLDAAYPVGDLREQLAQHPYFRKPETIPSWRALWHGSDLPPEDLDAVLVRFGEDLDRRTFAGAGEMLHVIGLALWLSDSGQPGWEAAGIVGRLEAYVDDVFSAEEPVGGGFLPSLDQLAGGSFNLGFYNQEDARFLGLAARMKVAEKARRRAGYPAVAGRLRDMTIKDPEGFLREVCFTEAGPSTYADAPVLSLIPPRDFAAEFAAATHAGQQTVAMALSIRYDQAQVRTELQEELPWLGGVVAELSRLAENMNPIPRRYVMRSVDQYMRKHVSQVPGGPGQEEAGSQGAS